jgi:hypothetical protein
MRAKPWPKPLKMALQSQLAMSHVNSIPGETEDQSSYQSKMGGVSGIIEAAGIICALYAIQSGVMEVGLDGDQAMKSIFGSWPLHPKQPDYDLLKDHREKSRNCHPSWNRSRTACWSASN